MYIYIHAYTSIYIYIHLYTSLYISLHLYTSLYISIHLYTSLYISDCQVSRGPLFLAYLFMCFLSFTPVLIYSSLNHCLSSLMVISDLIEPPSSVDKTGKLEPRTPRRSFAQGPPYTHHIP